MSEFIFEQTIRQKVTDEAEVFTDSIDNSAPFARIGISRESDNSVAYFRFGVGVTVPYVGEIIPHLMPINDYTSKDVYDIDVPPRTIEGVVESGYKLSKLGIDSRYWATYNVKQKSRVIAMYIAEMFMRYRQHLTIDAVSQNSQGPMLFGNSWNFSGVYSASDSDGYMFSDVARQLSTYNLLRIAREAAIPMFDKANGLMLAFDTSKLVDGFRGMVEFFLSEDAGGHENIVTKKQFIVTNDDGRLMFARLSEAEMLDKVVTEHISMYAEVLKSKAEDSIPVDGDIIEPGDFFVLNKTNRLISVSLSDGSVVKLNPYGIAKIDTDLTIQSVSVFKYVFARVGLVNCNIDGLLFKNEDYFKPTMVGKYFTHPESNTIYDYSPGNIKVFDSKKRPTGIGPYKLAGIDSDALVVKELGDNESKIYAVSDGAYDFYLDGEDLYVKRSDELTFTKLDFGLDEHRHYANSYGSFGALSLDAERTGYILRNPHFMYETNYIVSRDSVEGDVIGKVYPADFFATRRLINNICGGADNGFFGGYCNAKNEYAASEVRVVTGESNGVFGVWNSRNPEDDFVRYATKIALGLYNDNGFIIKSFGFVTRESQSNIVGEHFLSRMIRESNESITKKRYQPTADVFESEYAAMWIAAEDIVTGETILFTENEYRDEWRNHLSHLPYLSQQSQTCKQPAKQAEIRGVKSSDMFRYKMFMSVIGDSLNVAEVTRFDFDLGKGVCDPQFVHLHANSVKSNGKIGAFGVTAVTAQSESVGEVAFVDDTPLNSDVSEYTASDDRLIVVPHIGFSALVPSDIVIPNVESYTETLIREPGKRGVRLQFADGSYIDAFFESDGTNISYIYTMRSETSDYALTTSGLWPEQLQEDISSADRAVAFGKYMEIGNLSVVPLYLANHLFSRYNVSQCVVGYWDESNGVMIPDSSDISINKIQKDIGFELEYKVVGSDPDTYVDIHNILTIEEIGVPYAVSRQVVARVRKHGVIDFLDWDELNEAAAIYSDNKASADSRVVKSVMKSINSKTFMSLTPVVYMPQGYWSNPHDYTLIPHKIGFQEHIDYPVFPRKRLGVDINIGVGSSFIPSEEFDVFGEVYSNIDGYVDTNILLSKKDTPLERGNNTYKVKYYHHTGGKVFLEREIVVDLDVYPSIDAYLRNNLISALIVPIREDAHLKKMESRSVFVRFDTRYISDKLRSYYDKFAEVPTAMTCDALPEEAILTRGRDAKQNLFAERFSSVSGNELISSRGTIRVFFENETDVIKTVNLRFSTGMAGSIAFGRGVTAYNTLEPTKLVSSGIAFAGFEDKKDGRFTDGPFFENEVEGEL